MINELRLGNWIYFVSVVMDEQCRVLEPGENPYARKNPVRVQVSTFDKIEKSPENFAPIPLSPDILQASGFDNREGYLWFLNDDFYVHFRDGSLVYNGLPDGAPTLRNLHQLQNLYFALTGTELTINLDKVKV